ncbi:MAG: hypothetical protein ACKVOU_08360 [Cytophagales bacterium]
MSLGSGNITLRGRKVPIVWTGQFAEHVATTSINERSLHHFLHVEIQQMCQKAEFSKVSKSIYTSLVFRNGNTYLIVGELHTKVFYPKTCYKYNKQNES